MIILQFLVYIILFVVFFAVVFLVTILLRFRDIIRFLTGRHSTGSTFYRHSSFDNLGAGERRTSQKSDGPTVSGTPHRAKRSNADEDGEYVDFEEVD